MYQQRPRGAPRPSIAAEGVRGEAEAKSADLLGGGVGSIVSPAKATPCGESPGSGGLEPSPVASRRAARGEDDDESMCPASGRSANGQCKASGRPVQGQRKVAAMRRPEGTPWPAKLLAPKTTGSYPKHEQAWRGWRR